MQSIKASKIILIFTFLIISLIIPSQTEAQTYKWMNVGSLHNWFADMGCEVEVSRSSSSNQQDGLRWPAIYQYQDIQAAKGFWLGAKNFTDETGTYNYRVVHVGPRVYGFGEFFPVQFEMISKFPTPEVLVDGVKSVKDEVEVDAIDETIPCDRMLINKVNTLLGITMTRKIMAWGVPGHDNYILTEYEFENTGNTDGDPDIELPNNTVEDLMMFWQYRYAACFQTRYVIANGTGWGMNTMQDSRGDGDNPDLYGDPADERFRAQFIWHGFFPGKIVTYDNIGGPIWSRDAPGADDYVTERDTVGRLGAPQFAGMVTLHADKSTSEPVDDPAQPSTTGYYGSDEALTSNNDAYNRGKMELEYGWMTRGHMNPRHAWKVEPSGDFTVQTGAPNFPPGAPGGFSIGDGYGPYTLAPGEKIKIVLAEAVDGIGRDICIDIGRKYKNGQLSDKEKNEIVLTGKDSLMRTFRTAIDNFESGYTSVSAVPKPPAKVNIEGLGDRISIQWETFDEENLAGFRIYRQAGNYVDPLIAPDLIYVAGADERSYDDTSPVRGVAYYYYILAVGPSGATSSRFYSQTYDPAFLKRPPSEKISDVRVVPNPYIIRSEGGRLAFPGEKDKLAFFNIPGRCTIQIFTEIGELINEIDHTDGTGDEYWRGITSSNQVVVSGVYIAVITDKDTGEKEIVKFVVIR